jgi:hypothetical protein
MKLLIIILLAVNGALAQDPLNSYVSPNQVLSAKGYQIGVYGESFVTSKKIDEEGKEQVMAKLPALKKNVDIFHKSIPQEEEKIGQFDIKFGETYRDILENIFLKDFGYLPSRTNADRTQYMPFLFYKRGEKVKRKISFFELSGEVFKHFYEEHNGIEFFKEKINRVEIEKSFQTVKLLLKSENKKVHFFLIDYNQQTKYSVDNDGLTQSNYLEAAANYFRDNNEILKNRTDAVYVVVTKSDEIKGIDIESIANSFLNEHFGNFMEVLENQCNEYSIKFKVKIFSIGDVFFTNICKINRSYSADIIDDLLSDINSESKSLLSRLFKFMRK